MLRESNVLPPVTQINEAGAVNWLSTLEEEEKLAKYPNYGQLGKGPRKV